MASAVKLGDVDLLPGEVQVKAWRVEYVVGLIGLGTGTLYLTSERLIYVKGSFNWPWGPSAKIVSMGDIEQCSGRGGFPRGTLSIGLADGSEVRFRPFWPLAPKASEIATDINAILRERSPDHG